MAISPTDIRILFTNYDIITYFLNLIFWSEHLISIQHRILAPFNINKKINLSDCMPLRNSNEQIYLINHDSTEALTTVWVIPTGTNSPPARGIEPVILLKTDIHQWLVSPTNKTDRHDITEMLLKVALNTIKPKPNRPQACKTLAYLISPNTRMTAVAVIVQIYFTII